MIIAAVLVVPILLFGKPILFKMEMNKAKNHAVSYFLSDYLDVFTVQ
jgi:V-type H+-transporting ATPase subunit a